MKFFKKIRVEFIIESLGISLVAGGVAQFSIPASIVVIGAFLVWLVESAD